MWLLPRERQSPGMYGVRQENFGKEGFMIGRPPIDLTGQQFGDRLVLKRAEGKSASGHVFWICRCQCGSIDIVDGVLLRQGSSKHCQNCKPGPWKHGKARSGKKTAEYNIWVAARDGCNNPNREDWYLYGGRGVKFAEVWDDIEVFLRDLGPRPKGGSLDRFPDKDGNYEPGNCRWATSKEQARNKRNNRLLTYDSRTLTISQWAEEYKILPSSILWARVYRLHWPLQKALTTPIKRMKAG